DGSGAIRTASRKSVVGRDEIWRYVTTKYRVGHNAMRLGRPAGTRNLWGGPTQDFVLGRLQ
ncbi:MAG: hypothetical protein WAL85_17940, partial [Candidatus Korobacteraceae bacterium]